MRTLLRCAIVAAAIAATGCGGGDPDPASPPPANQGGTITGRERFGWGVATGSASDLALFDYAVYVDNARQVIQDASCSVATDTLSDCSAPLPSLTPGNHTLEVAVFVTSGSTTIEGPRSAPLTVTVTALTDGEPGTPEGGTLVASDGTVFSATLLARDLADPVDLAIDPAGRVLVAERRGRIRVFADGGELGDRSPPPVAGASALSIAVSPDFERSHHLYVMFAHAAAGGGRAAGVARMREDDGVLSEAAVVTAFEAPGDPPSGVLRFGPDGAMYVAMSAGADGEDAQRLSSYRGKILRFARDGRTAIDNPRSSPVYSSGHRDPRGLAWHPGNAALWEAEPSPGGDEINIITAGGDYGWPLEARSRGRVSTLTASVTLPAGSSPAGLTIVNDSSSVLFGDAIVSAPGLSDLLRIRADGEGRPMAGPPARIVQGRFGEVGAVAALGGALYFVTANQRLWGAGRDLLVRLVPVAP